jgi:hypothetical protein
MSVQWLDDSSVGQSRMLKRWDKFCCPNLVVTSTKGRPMFKTQELCRVIQRNKRLIASQFSQCLIHGPAGVSLEELDWGTFWPPVIDFLSWHLYAIYKAVKLLQSERFK